MPHPATTRTRRTNSTRSVARTKRVKNQRFLDAIAMAEQSGLLKGARTRIVRGRMTKALVDKAKENTGVESDTELLELALAHLATADEYATWLISQRGTIPKELDLEF